VQLQRRNAAHLRLCSKAEESHATLLPRRECACLGRDCNPSFRRKPESSSRRRRDRNWTPAFAGVTQVGAGNFVAAPRMRMSGPDCDPSFRRKPESSSRRRRDRNWTPAFAGVTLVSKASALLTATRTRLGFEGMARRKAQTYGSAILVGPRRAPFGAPHALFLVRYRYCAQVARSAVAPLNQAHVHLRRLATAGPVFRRECPASDPFVPFGFRLSAQTLSRDGDRLHWSGPHGRQPAPGRVS
jgi:hypothetical protein